MAKAKIGIKDINGWRIFLSYYNHVIYKLRINIERVAEGGSCYIKKYDACWLLRLRIIFSLFVINSPFFLLSSATSTSNPFSSFLLYVFHLLFKSAFRTFCLCAVILRHQKTGTQKEVKISPEWPLPLDGFTISAVSVARFRCVLFVCKRTLHKINQWSNNNWKLSD